MATPRRFEAFDLISASPGTRRQIVAHRFGEPGARPKAYLQASLHADELPGMLVLHHLLRRLEAADRQGQITGEIVVVPAANPIGLGQRLGNALIGRQELGGLTNFNRGHLQLAGEVAERAGPRLGADAAANASLIRQVAAELLAEHEPASELDHLKLVLARLAIDADLVLDLHCDAEAVLHLYLTEDWWPDAADLPAQLGCELVLLANESGGDPFDEAFSGLWIRLRQRFAGQAPVPLACLAATIELRGQADVDDGLAQADAQKLYKLLQRRGFVAGDPGPLPALIRDARPLTGLDYVKAPRSGLVVFAKKPGDYVAVGEPVADILDPLSQDIDRARLPVFARTDGVMVARSRRRMVRAGDIIADVAGARPLPHRQGKLLSD